MSLINREASIAKFQALLSPESPEWLLCFHGLNGLGKTTLLKHLHTRPEIAPAWIDFDLKSYRDYHNTVLEALERALRSHRLPPEAWAVYERECDAIAEWAAHDRIVASQTNLATAGSTISNVSQSMIVNMEEGLARIELEAARARTRAWLDLAEHLEGAFVILIDHWDALVQRGSPDFRAWMAQDVLLAAHQRSPTLRVVVASEQPLRETGLDEGVANVELPPLSRKHAGQLMREGGVNDPAIQAAIWERTGGNPLLLNLAITLWRQEPDLDPGGLVQGLSVRAASEWLLGRISERLADPRSRAVLERGVILVTWTRDLLEAVCERDDLDSSWYRLFTAYPFVQDAPGQPGLKIFIRTVREIQIAQLWRNHRPLFHTTHANAFRWYTVQHGVEVSP